MSLVRTLNRFAYLSITFLLVLVISVAANAQIPEDPSVISAGEALYNSNCKQCHNFERAGVGPNLKDAHKRWKLPNLISFIKAPQKYIETANDPYAKGLFEEFRQYMPNHPFTEEQTISLIAFIKHRSETAAPVPGGGELIN